MKATRSVSAKLTVISLCSTLFVGLFILVLHSGPAAFAQAPATRSAEDSKSRRELAADLLAANNLIADLQNKLAKTNSELSAARSELEKTKADLATLTKDKKTVDTDLVNANAEINSLKNAKVKLVFYVGDKVDDKHCHFHIDLPLSGLLEKTSTLSHGGHGWEGCGGGKLDFDDGLCKVFTVHATK